jgi:hypothetical protein
MANRKHLIRVVTTAGDTTGFSEFVAGSTDGGPLIPSFTTTERNAISSATTGELIYNSTTSRLEVYNGSSWQVLEQGDVTGVTTDALSGLDGGAGSGDVDLNIDVTRLADGTSVDVDEDNDLVILYDNSDTTHKKINPVQLNTTEALTWMGL